MTDIALDPVTLDLPDPAAATLLTGLEALAQRVRIAVATARLEWWLDRSWGMAYREVWLGRAPDLRLVEADIRRMMQRVPGVARVRDVRLSIAGAERRLDASWTIEGESGETLTIQTDPTAPVEVGVELRALLFSSPAGPVGSGLSPIP